MHFTVNPKRDSSINYMLYVTAASATVCLILVCVCVCVCAHPQQQAALHSARGGRPNCRLAEQLHRAGAGRKEDLHKIVSQLSAEVE